jgi:hypothetical protein
VQRQRVGAAEGAGKSAVPLSGGARQLHAAQRMGRRGALPLLTTLALVLMS